MPMPPAAFSPLATTQSSASSSRRMGTSALSVRRPAEATTSPMKRIIGVESWNAVCTPIEACVAPGPRVTKHTPGVPVSLPAASAMLAAPASWRALISLICRLS